MHKVAFETEHIPSLYSFIDVMVYCFFTAACVPIHLFDPTLVK